MNFRREALNFDSDIELFDDISPYYKFDFNNNIFYMQGKRCIGFDTVIRDGEPIGQIGRCDDIAKPYGSWIFSAGEKLHIDFHSRNESLAGVRFIYKPNFALDQLRRIPMWQSQYQKTRDSIIEVLLDSPDNRSIVGIDCRVNPQREIDSYSLLKNTLRCLVDDGEVGWVEADNIHHFYLRGEK